MLSLVEGRGESLEDSAFRVDVFIESRAWYVDQCVLVVFVECVGVVVVPPCEVGWGEYGGKSADCVHYGFVTVWAA